MARVEVDAGGDWLSLHKKIGAVTLWICAAALGGNVVWLAEKSPTGWRYDTEDVFLIGGIILVMALAAALMRSISYAAGIEREQERTSFELQRSQASLRAVVKFMPVGVVVVEAPSGRLIMANDQHEQLLRYMLVPGATLWDQCGQKVFHSDGRPFTYSDWPIAKAIHAGEIVLDGRSNASMTIASARAAGVAYLPSDRGRAGFAESSVAENVGIADFQPVTRGPMVDGGAVRRDAWSVIRDMGVVPADPERGLRALSGGNQQKVLFGKWRRVSPRLMVLNEPTYGVDVISRRELFAGIRRARDEGMAVIWITTDLEEAVAISDRVGVFFQGRLRTISKTSEVSALDLNRAATGL